MLEVLTGTLTHWLVSPYIFISHLKMYAGFLKCSPPMWIITQTGSSKSCRVISWSDQMRSRSPLQYRRKVEVVSHSTGCTSHLVLRPRVALRLYLPVMVPLCAPLVIPASSMQGYLWTCHSVQGRSREETVIYAPLRVTLNPPQRERERG